jgi:predicted nucleic acid-binding protein
MSRIYWDTMLFVYWLEEHPDHGARMSQIHERMEARRDTLCTSGFTLGEVLTGLYKRDALEMATRRRRTSMPGFGEITAFPRLTRSTWRARRRPASTFSRQMTTVCSGSPFRASTLSPGWM